MDSVDFEEGWFKDPTTGLELNIQYDGKTAYITFFDLDGKPAGKKVIEVTDETLIQIQSLLDDYKRVDDGRV